MEKEIKFRLQPGVDMPSYKEKGASGICVTANSILAIYNNGEKLPAHILKRAQDGFIKRGYIKLRVNERIVFGTGVNAEIPEGIELQATTLTNMYAEKGVHVINQPGYISAGALEEISIILASSVSFVPTIKHGEMKASSATFLPTICKGEEIAQLIVKPVFKPFLSRIIEIDEDDIVGEDFM